MHALFLPEKLTRFSEVYKRNFNRNEGKAQGQTDPIYMPLHLKNRRFKCCFKQHSKRECFAFQDRPDMCLRFDMFDRGRSCCPHQTSDASNCLMSQLVSSQQTIANNALMHFSR